MALAGEKVGIPTAEEAPMIVMARYKQPIAGILSIIIVFVISYITWLIFFDPRWHNPIDSPDVVMEVTAWATVIGGFGLIGVVWAIWFENWPYYNWFRTPWKVGLVGTAINAIIIVIFVLGLLPLFNTFYGSEITDPYIKWFVGASIFGALSGSCFSFGVLWVAGTMYWPFFKIKQPKRGIIVWIIGNAITLLVWFLLFFPTGERTATSEASAVKPVTAFPSYAFSLGWTQWLIFFSLLTLMVYEYWPWSKLARKQPFIGMIAFGVCTILGLVFSLIGPYIAAGIFDPFFVLIQSTTRFGGIPPDPVTRFKGWYMMSITYAIFLICAVVLVSLFFDNWPKKYTQLENFIIRSLMVIGIGTLTFLGYYLLSPLLFGDNPNFFRMNPTPFTLWFLWIEILFAYVWRKWPIYRAVG